MMYQARRLPGKSSPSLFGIGLAQCLPGYGLSFRFAMLRPIHLLSVLMLFILSGLPLFAAPAYQGCTETGGTLTRQPYRSTLIATNMVYTVYTPPCYDQTNTDYPVLYLLHGSTSDDNHWLQLGLAEALNQGIAQGTLPPLIVVLPFGNWIANENQFGEVSWEMVFTQELMPLVESRYRIQQDQAGRAIGGISRGGFWAFEIAFRHPELFSAVGGHSAFFDPDNAPPEYNPLDLALTAPGLDTLRIWMDRGPDDYARQGLNLMQERLNQRGLPHTYQLYAEGDHSDTYWSQHVADYLAFYTSAWREGSAVTPLPFATNTPQPTPPPETGLTLFMPAVSFPSLQTSISHEALDAVRAGEPDANLVLSDSTASTLENLGMALSPEIRITPDDALFNLLWSNRRLYTLLPFNGLTPRYRVLMVDGVHPLDGDLTTYPFTLTSGQPNFYPERLTRLMLSGVTALTRQTREALDQHGIEWAGEAIRPYTTRADFFHTSNEVSFTPNCPEPGDEPLLGAFCAKDAHYGLLDFVGVDIIELTGNHNNDYGFAAYLDTLRRYHDDGFKTVGGGATVDEARSPLILNHHGNTIAMVACNWIGPYYALATENNPGAAYCDWDWLSATIPDLAALYDVVVVTVQYEEFEEYTPPPRQEADFRALADLGADVVVGTQAHKPMTFTFYNPGRDSEAFIHYGLGNLFFDQPFWGNMRFFMDDLFIYEGRLLTVNLFTGIIDDNARPRPMTADEQENFLAFMFNTQGGF
ncbi:MAG: CapA family protein [Anaerolineaceae bacterium]|nr:CapA family protein [Anaerolineaceae bacterium]